MAGLPPPPPQQQAVVEHGREPCPDRILGGCGSGRRRARDPCPGARCRARAALCPASVRLWMQPQENLPARTAPVPAASPSHITTPPRLHAATDDIGGAFGMGALGGGLWHTYRGLKNSPKGYKIAGTLEVRPRVRRGPTQTVVAYMLLSTWPAAPLRASTAAACEHTRCGGVGMACRLNTVPASAPAPAPLRRCAARARASAAILPTGASCFRCLTAPACTSAKRCAGTAMGTGWPAACWHTATARTPARCARDVERAHVPSSVGGSRSGGRALQCTAREGASAAAPSARALVTGLHPLAPQPAGGSFQRHHGGRADGRLPADPLRPEARVPVRRIRRRAAGALPARPLLQHRDPRVARAPRAAAPSAIRPLQSRAHAAGLGVCCSLP